MKVRITKMRYIEGTGRVRPGQVIEWPHEKLGRGMVPAEEAEKVISIDGRRKKAHDYIYMKPVPGAKPAPVTVKQIGGPKVKDAIAASEPVVKKEAADPKRGHPAKTISNQTVL